VRGAVVPLTSAFQVFTPVIGITWSGLAVGAAALVLAAVALSLLGETHGRDLNFLEH
jgi:putative MFS transporter